MSVFTAAGGAAGAGPLPPEPSPAPLPRDDTAPETPGLAEHQGSAGSAAAEGLRGSREWGGVLQPDPFTVVPPRPLPSPWPFTAWGWASGCCRGLCQRQGRAVLLTGRCSG